MIKRKREFLINEALDNQAVRTGIDVRCQQVIADEHAVIRRNGKIMFLGRDARGQRAI